MTTLITVLLLLGFSLVIFLGLLNVLQDLIERNVQGGPIFQEQGALFHDQGVEHQEARSQFAWQSRSHFRAPD